MVGLTFSRRAVSPTVKTCCSDGTGGLNDAGARLVVFICFRLDGVFAQNQGNQDPIGRIKKGRDTSDNLVNNLLSVFVDREYVEMILGIHLFCPD